VLYVVMTVPNITAMYSWRSHYTLTKMAHPAPMRPSRVCPLIVKFSEC
jgi:hypothetical protein